MNPEIVIALNKYENAHYNAVRRDMQAELAEEWESQKLKMCEEAWVKCRVARVELEALIVEHTKATMATGSP